MTASSITLPNGDTVTVFHATGKNGAAGLYFNAKRLGATVPSTQQRYLGLVSRLQQELVQEVMASGVQFDAIVCPPSSSNDAEPYRSAILDKWPVTDLTATFTRNGRMKAQSSETTVEDLIKSEFVHKPNGYEPVIRSILIVDEAIATGKTAAALLELLRRAGMPVCAKVSIAVCSKMN